MVRKLDEKMVSPLDFGSDHIRLLVIILLATALRLFHLGKQSLWLDEAWSYTYALVPLRASLETLLVSGDPPSPDIFLIRLFLIVGKNETIIRFPSFIFGVLSVAVIYRVGRLILDSRLGLVSALFLALNPFHLWYSQEARMYSVGMFSILAASYFFLRLLQKNSWRTWGGFIVFSSLAYYSYYVPLQIALAQFVLLLCYLRTYRVLFRKWVVAQALAFAPLLPWLALYFSQDTPRIGIGWIPKPTILAPLETLWAFSSGYSGGLTAGAAIALLPFCLALALGTLSVMRDSTPHKLFLFLWLVVPITATFLLSLLRPIYVHRYLIFALPAYLTLMACGIMNTPTRIVRLALTAVVLAIMFNGLLRIYFDPGFFKQDWRGAANYVQNGAQTGDVIAVESFEDVPPFKYYYKGDLKLIAVNNQSFGDFEESMEGYERLWLIYHRALSGRSDSNTERWLNLHRKDVLEEKDLPGLRVILYQLSP